MPFNPLSPLACRFLEHKQEDTVISHASSALTASSSEERGPSSQSPIDRNERVPPVERASSTRVERTIDLYDCSIRLISFDTIYSLHFEGAPLRRTAFRHRRSPSVKHSNGKQDIVRPLSSIRTASRTSRFEARSPSVKHSNGKQDVDHPLLSKPDVDRPLSSIRTASKPSIRTQAVDRRKNPLLSIRTASRTSIALC